MGLDCSHDAFHGPYSVFNRLRQAVCRAIGGSFPPHEDRRKDNTQIYFPDGMDARPGLYEFVTHSDCDGEILPEMCAVVANELEAILPCFDPATKQMVQQFIAGCRRAARRHQRLTFH